MKLVISVEGTPEEMLNMLPEHMDGSSAEVDVQVRVGNRPKYVGRVDKSAHMFRQSDRWQATFATNGDLEEGSTSGLAETPETGPRDDTAHSAVSMAYACACAVCVMCSLGSDPLLPPDGLNGYRHRIPRGETMPCKASAIHRLIAMREKRVGG